MARSAHHLIADAERIHDVEGEQRDVRCLEHVAAGVEHEIRRLARGAHRSRLLAEPRQHFVVELKLREDRNFAAEIAVFFQRLLPPRRQVAVSLGHRNAGHPQQKARVDAFVASGDAFA
jgi:hypothetical protein